MESLSITNSNNIKKQEFLIVPEENEKLCYF